jgi:hypothetical protein
MKARCVFRLWVVVVALCLASPLSANEPPRAVLELFTSQGCSSCLPADKVLSSYVHQDKNIIALTFPVTIWDYLGWRDTLASPENTQRQRSYAAVRGDMKLYTPQVIINGSYHAVGSDREEIEKKCMASKEGSALRVPINILADKGAVDISIAAWPGLGEPPRARVYLVSFAKEKSVPIAAGENAGLTTSYTNVVETMQEVGYWSGKSLSLRLFWQPAASQGGAVLLQSVSHDGPGVIYGATKLP